MATPTPHHEERQVKVTRMDHGHLNSIIAEKDASTGWQHGSVHKETIVNCLMLGCEDNHETTEASERDQRASERDQNGILAWDQMCVVSVTRDQNHEKARDASMARDQNHESASMAQDQNDENDYKGNTQFGGTKEKQMTYREALLGLDNSELSSDF